MSERKIPQEYLDYWEKYLTENPPGPLPAESQAVVTALLGGDASALVSQVNAEIAAVETSEDGA